MKRYWFKRKTYGWGWYPASIEGWGVLVAYAIAVVLLFRNIDESGDALDFFVPFGLLTIALVAVSWLTGETPRWQWGEKDE